jgi:TfoX/Sxy family transcriptional regulator of competence genes
MAWRKNSAEMVKVLDEALKLLPAQRRMMFGCPAYFVNDNMFAGLHQDSLILRLSEQDRQTLLSTWDEASQFEPMEGRPMREYVVLPEPLYADSQLFSEWVNRSFAYASSLPPKAPKSKKR